jgi:secondary thiamine-phosphate synthase enzyme
MQIFQETIKLTQKPRGFHLITDEILQAIDLSNIKTGMLNIFLQHTSASLCINENCEREVRTDLEKLMNQLCDDKSYYEHTYEGRDDMPAHAKSALFGVSLNIPITEGKLNLGTWQGIYLGEHREYGGNRKLILTVTGI